MAPKTRAAASGITTVMFRNMPRGYNAWELARELSRFFFTQSDFDFVYVPWDRRLQTNMGFGFVNFRDARGPAIAALLMRGQAWMCAQHSLRIQAEEARHQGLVENLRLYGQAVARHGGVVWKHAPIVFEDGVQLPIEVALDKYCLSPEAHVFTQEYPKHFIAQAFQARASREEFFEDDTRTGDMSMNDWSPTASVASAPPVTERFLPPPGLPTSPTLNSLPAFEYAGTFPTRPDLSPAQSLDNLRFQVRAKRVPPPRGLPPSPALDDSASNAGRDAPIFDLMASYNGPISF